ncbi:MAG: tRNA 2-thiouridine(34) synthase MnmA [Spirochaeta sp.]|nr:tRNA 2-thiouridine(34) synthase MnmA [Spirochaeta sp.]
MALLAVALSGGVDSSVAALLLKKQWPAMVGASHFIWPESRCCSAEVFTRARMLCERLKIPYYQVDLYPEFKELVVGDFIATYLKGKTPNPCIICNQRIRFDLFYYRLEALLREKKQLSESEQGEPLFFATGHYVRIVSNDDGLFLAKAKYGAKDQSYMLYRIKKELLQHLVFPLGDYLKDEVNELAAQAGLGYESVEESQDACFVDTDYTDFLQRQTGKSELLKPGEIVDSGGKILGKHRGYLYYTVGQRRGLGLGDGPWYVQRLDAEKNLVYVAREEEAKIESFRVENLNLFVPDLAERASLKVKIRYQRGEIPCRVQAAGNKLQVILKWPAIVTPGQSAVFYQKDLVLGGGIIC